MKVLELRDATLVKGGRTILDSLDLAIEAGEHTAILGPNGSGKSSLIRLLTHHHHALAREEGPSVRVMEEDRWNVEELRSRLGIVSPDLQRSFEAGSVLGPLTALEAVISGFFASEILFLHHVVTAEMRDGAREALEMAGAATLEGKRMNEMSTGEARRVLIARALVTSPAVLVLDEPTTGLDLVARGRFLERLRSIVAREVTLLLITHHVEEILPEIRRVLLLDAGRIVFDGPTAEALQAPRLSRLVGAPVRVERRGGWYGANCEF